MDRAVLLGQGAGRFETQVTNWRGRVWNRYDEDSARVAASKMKVIPFQECTVPLFWTVPRYFPASPRLTMSEADA